MARRAPSPGPVPLGHLSGASTPIAGPSRLLKARSLALALALAVVALAVGALACGGAPRTVAPRSSCADAAASITRGLRVAAPDDAGGVGELEPRFARACQSSRWRPNVVRCFALARDPAEQRVCARRLEPAQRDEARLIQATLDRPASRPRSLPARGLDGACARLGGPVLDAAMSCPRFAIAPRELHSVVETFMRRAAEAAASGDREQIDEIAAQCDQLAATLVAVLAQSGC